MRLRLPYLQIEQKGVCFEFYLERSHEQIAKKADSKDYRGT